MKYVVNRDYAKYTVESIYRCTLTRNSIINNDIMELIMRFMEEAQKVPKILAITDYIYNNFDIKSFGLEIRIDKAYLGLPFYIRVEGEQ